ncbi:MAG: YigZ family protein [Bacteroidales bacterium]|nr:YigZ family protein [Bacteroidales bacterium]MBR0499473.1 YigZ family protein [Bacteroidales bacterium]
MNSISDTYFSIAGPSEGIYKELGSKFLAFAWPVETEEEAKARITAVRKEYFDARHHCFAWRLGLTGEPYRLSDDGEPSSTAGRPIHGQLLSRELSDVLVVVVRYFGGVKLGVPGLIRAYKTATQDALDHAEVIEKVAGRHFTIQFGYLQMNDVMKTLKDMGIAPIRQDFDLDCTMEVRVRLSQIEDFRKQLSFCQINLK